jgi:hypothetical protein
MTQEILDDYRPYNDNEVPAAVHRIAEDPLLEHIVQFVFPEKNVSDFITELKQIQTVEEFQGKIMDKAIRRVIDKTITHLSYSGVERLSNDKSYMFISNHRDIVLDSAILQTIFFTNKIKTSEITFGSNLMRPQLVVDIGKINKMFKIVRSGTAREIFVNSLNVSEYMRYAITEKHQSTWIAQRNGRTKDGFDKTEIAVLKMFAMSSKKPFIENLGDLNITPVAVSYEYEPCDFMKTREIYFSRRGHYQKTPGEDLNSIMHGIMQFKGNMQLSICESVTAEELTGCAKMPNPEQFRELANIIDRKIYAGYHLWKTNYMAHDILHKKSDFTAFYSPADRDKFIDYMNSGLGKINGDSTELQEIFLGIYANPVETSL